MCIKMSSRAGGLFEGEAPTHGVLAKFLDHTVDLLTPAHLQAGSVATDLNWFRIQRSIMSHSEGINHIWELL